MARHSREDNDLNHEARKSDDLLLAYRASRQTQRNAEDRFARDNDSGRASGRHSAPGQEYPTSLVDFIRRNSSYILGASAVVVIVVLLLVFLHAFSPVKTAVDPTSDTFAYTTPFDWENLDYGGGRYVYRADGAVRSKLGVDVSDNQHEVDWDAVASDGIDFAIIRLGYRGATEGVLHLDERYEANMAGARAAGVKRGVYFFSQACTAAEGAEEADFVLANLDGADLDYPVVFDSEEAVAGVENPRTVGLDADTMSAVAAAFCDRVKSAGYDVMIYGNGHDLLRFNYEKLTGYDIWWAEYDVAAPSAYLDIVMWQYASDGYVAGIDYAVDMNIDLSEALD